MAFSETLRGTVWKTRKITLGFFFEFIIHPLRSAFAGLVHAGSPVLSNDSPLKDRLDRYLGYRRHRRQFLDDDIWTRHEDRVMVPLPTVEEFELKARGRSKGRNEGFSEKSRATSRLRRFI